MADKKPMDPGKAAIIAAVITAGGAVVVALIALASGKVTIGPELRFPVAVLDATSRGSIEDAEVSLNLPEFSPEQTDSGGKHTFRLTKQVIGKSARLTVSKTGYDGYNLEIPSLQPRDDYFQVLLRKPAPTVAVHPPEPPAELVRVYSSGAQYSGSRKDFSGWYPLCSNDPPAGYTIKRADFRLSGDRSCGGWAVCEPVSQTASQVCWQFKMQGHDEWPGSGQSVSEGILTVTWGR